jgi:hypothetical protein
MDTITYSFPSEQILFSNLLRGDRFDQHPLITTVFPRVFHILGNQHQMPTKELKNILVKCITECAICADPTKLAGSALILLAPYADNLEETLTNS